MVRFSLFGIPVQIQPWFWISLALIGGGTTANTKEAILQLALFLIAGLVSILVHELGHALTGRAFGADTEITLQAFGGFAAFFGARFTRLQSFLVTAAGPGAQILLGIVIYLLIPILHTRSLLLTGFWQDLIEISVFWAVINLLPVLPLDGGQMLNALLGPARIKITLWVTILTAVSVALLILSYFGASAIIFPIFLGMFVWQAWQHLQQLR